MAIHVMNGLVCTRTHLHTRRRIHANIHAYTHTYIHIHICIQDRNLKLLVQSTFVVSSVRFICSFKRLGVR